MITFDSSFTSLGISVTGQIDEVPINEYLRDVHIDRVGVIVMDTSGNWGHIHYQDTSFNSNIALFNYLYNYKRINTPITKKIEICSADLTASFSSPIELVAAAGNGLINVPVGLGYKYKYKSVVYDFAQNIFVHCSSKTDADAFFVIDKGIINAAADRSNILAPVAVAGVSNDDAFVANDSIILKAKTSDATTGDGSLVIYITYSVVEESWYDSVYCT